MIAPFHGKRVLVAGGLGFIGSNLAARLVALGARVTLVDNLEKNSGANAFNILGVKPYLNLLKGDIRNTRKAADAVRGQEILFNLIGLTSHFDSMQAPEKDLEINCHAQLSLLEACRLYNPTIRIVFSGTRQIYGTPRFLPVDESHPIDPVDINGIHKWAGEHYHRVYSKVYGLPVTILRLTNTYGPRMRVRDERQTFLGLWIRQSLENLPLTIFGNGHQFRDFNYVEDVLDAMLLAASHSIAIGQTYNLGGRKTFSLNHLAQLLIEMSGSKAGFQNIPFCPERKAIDIGSYQANFTRISKSLGWKPQISLTDGLRLTLQFYRKHKKYYW